MKFYASTFVASLTLLFATTQSSFAELVGVFPEEGGKITISPTGAAVNVGGIEMVPSQGTLTQGEDPAPFSFFIPNSSAPENVTLGQLGTPVLIDGPVTLDVTASADAIISATWGKGVVPEPFPITGGGKIDGLKGSFPYDGGPVTIEPWAPQIPYSARQLSLEATAGSLTGGGSAAPFDSLTENTAQKWSANSNANVTIDGPVVLDLTASPDAIVSGQASDGTESTNVRVKRNSPGKTNTLVGSFAFGGGPITLESTAAPVTTRGIDLSIGRQGSFEGGQSPAPYTTLDANNSSERWKVSSDTDVVIDGRVTLDVAVTRNSFVDALVTDGSVSSSFDIRQRDSLRLSGQFPFAGGPITLRSGRGASISGLELTAESGTLTGGGSAAPFESLDANSTDRWSVSSASPITLDGEVTLDVQASGNALIQGLADDGYDKTVVPVQQERPVPTSSLRGSYPGGGGPITIESVGAAVVSRGLDFNNTSGGLTSGGSPAPFETLTTNTSTQWAVSSATDVTIDGAITLDVSTNGNRGLSAATLSNDGWRSFNVFPSSAGNGDGLQGSFPSDGGPITVSPMGAPIVTSGIEIKATQGTLAQGDSPAPFQFFLPNSRTENQITWGMLGTTVTIDGPVTLDATASADAVLSGLWGNGPTPVSISFNLDGNGDGGNGGGGNEVANNPPLTPESIDLAIEDLDPAVLESQLLVLFPEGGGPLTLMGTNGPVETLGVEFIVNAGELFQGDSAAPFEFFLGEEDAGKVVLGSLGVPVVIDEPITLDIFASADAVLSGQWGEGSLATFPAFAVPNVPEPNGSLLASLGLLSLLALRRRK